nr:uncharacterized protein LOC111517677 [Leptinotarsa decemlineata]
MNVEKTDQITEPLPRNVKATTKFSLSNDCDNSSRIEISYAPIHHGLLINLLCEDKSTQTDFGDIFEVPQMFRSDENLSHFTGINHQQLKVLAVLSKKLAVEKGILEKNIKLWLILVLCKLKTNLTFDCLGILLGTGTSLCSKMFYSMISILARSVKPGIHWPTREYVLKNTPKCFNMFPNTRVVLDSIEVAVLRLKCLNCRDVTDSHYKSKHTMKFLIGITPSGVITFVSSAYRGHISEKDIFHNEELIKKLEAYDAIMVGEDLLIEKECEQHFVEVFQPPILRNRNQLSKDEEELAARIAKARVYVDMAVEGIKNFAILNEQIDCYTVPYIDDIMTVVAVLVNLTLPIIAS